MFPHTSVATIYAAWFFLRSLLTRGWWLVTSLYLVTEAALSPFELVFLGTAQGLTVLVAEVPAGVFADAYSRKRSLMVAHLLMGLGMLSTGLVLSFPALIVTQMIWGLSWTFSSGADVAWLTDELDEPHRTSEVLISAAKWGHAGSALGILSFGALAWVASLSTAIVSAGAGMLVLGTAVMILFSEKNFKRAEAGEMLSAAARTLRDGMLRIRSHRVLLHVLICTYLVNGADEAFGRLYAKQLVELGLPADPAPIIWLSLLAIVSLGLSVAALTAVNNYLRFNANHSRAYSTAAMTGALGLCLFAVAPSVELASVAVLLVGGVATSVLRTVSVIWANEQATNQVRATVQSFLSLSENVGEVSLGFLLAIVANYAGIPAAMFGSCAAFAVVAVFVERRARQIQKNSSDS